MSDLVRDTAVTITKEKDAKPPLAPKKPKPATRTDDVKSAVKRITDAEAHAAALSSPNNKDYAIYVTANKENSTFDIRANGKTFTGHRDPTKKYIVFRIPKDASHSFEQHTHFKTGRIVRA